MTLEQTRILTRDIGGSRDPDVASFKVSGAIATFAELQMEAKVHVAITDADGQVIASGYGEVSNIGFKKHKATRSRSSMLERIHTIGVEL